MSTKKSSRKRKSNMVDSITRKNSSKFKTYLPKNMAKRTPGTPVPISKLESHGNNGLLNSVFDLILVFHCYNYNAESNKRRLRQIKMAKDIGYKIYIYPCWVGKDFSKIRIPPTFVTPGTVKLGMRYNKGGLGHGVGYLEMIDLIKNFSGFKPSAKTHNKSRRKKNLRTLILEDDSLLTKATVKRIVKQVKETVPDFDVLTMGFYPFTEPVAWPYKNSQWDTRRNAIYRPQGGWATHGWAFSKRGAARTIKLMKPWADPFTLKGKAAKLYKKFVGISPVDSRPIKFDYKKWYSKMAASGRGKDPSPASIDISTILALSSDKDIKLWFLPCLGALDDSCISDADEGSLIGDLGRGAHEELMKLDS